MIEKVIIHIQETEWDDNTRPDAKASLDMPARISYLLAKMNKHRTLVQPMGSLVVHCSAGCGRTGTLIALYVLIDSICFQISSRSSSKPSSEHSAPDEHYDFSQERISVFGVVRRLREQRWNLVKN